MFLYRRTSIHTSYLNHFRVLRVRNRRTLSNTNNNILNWFITDVLNIFFLYAAAAFVVVVAVVVIAVVVVVVTVVVANVNTLVLIFHC